MNMSVAATATAYVNAAADSESDARTGTGTGTGTDAGSGTAPQASAAASSSVAVAVDIEAMLQAMHLRDGRSPSEAQVSELANALQQKVGMKSLSSQSDYWRSMALDLMRLNLVDRRGEATTTARTRLSASISTSSSSSSSSGSMATSPRHTRGRSPAPRTTQSSPSSFIVGESARRSQSHQRFAQTTAQPAGRTDATLMQQQQDEVVAAALADTVSLNLHRQTGRESPRLDPSAHQPVLLRSGGVPRASSPSPRKSSSPSSCTPPLTPGSQHPRPESPSVLISSTSNGGYPSHSHHYPFPLLPRSSSLQLHLHHHHYPQHSASATASASTTNSNSSSSSPPPPLPNPNSNPNHPSSPQNRRPISPYYARPGLQEHDDQSVCKSPQRKQQQQPPPPPQPSLPPQKVAAQTPPRRILRRTNNERMSGGGGNDGNGGINNNLDGSMMKHHRHHHHHGNSMNMNRGVRVHTRSSSCNVQQMRRGVNEDEDDSVQQPAHFFSRSGVNVNTTSHNNMSSSSNNNNNSNNASSNNSSSNGGAYHNCPHPTQHLKSRSGSHHQPRAGHRKSSSDIIGGSLQAESWMVHDNNHNDLDQPVPDHHPASLHIPDLGGLAPPPSPSRLSSSTRLSLDHDARPSSSAAQQQSQLPHPPSVLLRSAASFDYPNSSSSSNTIWQKKTASATENCINGIRPSSSFDIISSGMTSRSISSIFSSTSSSQFPPPLSPLKTSTTAAGTSNAAAHSNPIQFSMGAKVIPPSQQTPTKFLRRNNSSTTSPRPSKTPAAVATESDDDDDHYDDDGGGKGEATGVVRDSSHLPQRRVTTPGRSTCRFAVDTHNLDSSPEDEDDGNDRVASPMEIEKTPPNNNNSSNNNNNQNASSGFHIGEAPLQPHHNHHSRQAPRSKPPNPFSSLQTHCKPHLKPAFRRLHQQHQEQSPQDQKQQRFFTRWTADTPAIPPPEHAPVPLPEATLQPTSNDLRRDAETQLSNQIAALRNEAGLMYSSLNYKGAIRLFTIAINMATDRVSDPMNSSNSSSSVKGGIHDTLAILYSNRAACFLMVYAYQAAISDCQRGLPLVNENLTTLDAVTNDSGPLLKVKLQLRLARALLKHGNPDRSISAFEAADKEASRVQSIIRILLHPNNQSASETIMQSLQQMSGEATLGKTEASRLREQLNKISSLTTHSSSSLSSSLHPSFSDSQTNTEALGLVNAALKVASGSTQLHEIKMKLLCGMKRWREAAGFCERLAVTHVQFDGIFVDRLESENPFPHAPPAVLLKPNYFDEVKDESATESDLKLLGNQVYEAVVRLHPALLPFYFRALRLEERYPAAEAGLRSLDEHGRSLDLPWLSMEKEKLAKTKTQREIADDKYRVGEYDHAAQLYAACILIDADGFPGESAGGRLHAVLQCNRAACFMALRRFHEAIDVCTAALRIHSRYMKAMLRRGRCYGRLQRYTDAISELQRYIELVEEARKQSSSKSVVFIVTPCLFDGPRDVKDDELAAVMTELDNLKRSQLRSQAAARAVAEAREARHKDRFAGFFNRDPPATNHANSRNDSASAASHNARRETNEDRSSTSSSSSHHHHRSESNHTHRDIGGGGWGAFDSRRSKTQSSGSSASQFHQRSKSYDSSPRTQQLKKFLEPSSDHYSILGLARYASIDDIKKAYRKLALVYHPDKNKSENASEVFLRIKHAFETLSDATKKRAYDTDLRYQNRNRSYY